MSSPPGAAVLVHGLRKAYGQRPVLHDVTFEVGRGEVLALLGPNGAGKTTTLEILEGYRRADAGDVRVLGLDPARDGARLRPRLGLMLQDGGVDPRTTPREIVRLFARFFRDPIPPDDLLTMLGLDGVAATRYRRLSGGERQRVALALALVGRPELLVLDEPTAGMDPEAKTTTRALIRDLRRDGATILLTTHDLADVERLADRVAILADGRVAALGAPSALASGSPALRFRSEEPADAEILAALGGALGARLVPERDGRIRLDGRIPDPALVAALASACADRGLLLAELTTGGGTLEDRYLELVGTHAVTEPERERGLRA